MSNNSNISSSSLIYGLTLLPAVLFCLSKARNSSSAQNGGHVSNIGNGHVQARVEEDSSPLGTSATQLKRDKKLLVYSLEALFWSF